MNLTRRSEYGLKGLLYLAANSQKSVVLTSEVSQSQSIPQSFLNKIFQKLAKAGILQSYRGARGGFALAKQPEEITLRKIIEVLEGPMKIGSLDLNPESGYGDVISNDSSGAVLDSVWLRLHKHINSLLDKITVSDLINEYKKK